MVGTMDEGELREYAKCHLGMKGYETGDQDSVAAAKLHALAKAAAKKCKITESDALAVLLATEEGQALSERRRLDLLKPRYVVRRRVGPVS
jgi:hypothetical protein